MSRALTLIHPACPVPGPHLSDANEVDIWRGGLCAAALLKIQIV